jgi:hypothetical protein
MSAQELADWAAVSPLAMEELPCLPADSVYWNVWDISLLASCFSALEEVAAGLLDVFH